MKNGDIYVSTIDAYHMPMYRSIFKINDYSHWSSKYLFGGSGYIKNNKIEFDSSDGAPHIKVRIRDKECPEDYIEVFKKLDFTNWFTNPSVISKVFK